MSRSKKKPILKLGRHGKEKYWKIVRSRQKNEIKSGVHPEDVSHPKTIINDYDHCDMILFCNGIWCGCSYFKCKNK